MESFRATRDCGNKYTIMTYLENMSLMYSLTLVRDSRAPRIQSCRQRIALFKGLQVKDMEDRLLALEKVFQVIKSYIRSSLSPSSKTTSPNLSDTNNTYPDISSMVDEEYDYSDNNIDVNEQIFYYSLTLLRLSMTCPYIDIRQSCKEFLIGLKVIKYMQSKYYLIW